MKATTRLLTWSLSVFRAVVGVVTAVVVVVGSWASFNVAKLATLSSLSLLCRHKTESKNDLRRDLVPEFPTRHYRVARRPTSGTAHTMSATFTKRKSSTATSGAAKKRTRSRTAGSCTGVDKASIPDRAVALKVATWNVDGLGESNLRTRTRAAARILREARPDVILLQEVIRESADIFDQHFRNLYVQVGGEPRVPGTAGARGGVPHLAPYFTLMYVSKGHSVLQAQRGPFTGPARSGMLRDMLIADVEVGGVRVRLLTSHLESGKSCSKIRVAQLTEVFGRLSKFDGPVLCGGDFNMRNAEQKQVLKTYDEFQDVYLHFGSPRHAMPTWRGMIPRADGSKFELTCRFDRVFINRKRIAYTDNAPLAMDRDAAAAKTIRMLGEVPIEGVGRPSDHLGMMVTVLVWNDPSKSETRSDHSAKSDTAATSSQESTPQWWRNMSPREAAARAALERAKAAKAAKRHREESAAEEVSTESKALGDRVQATTAAAAVAPDSNDEIEDSDSSDDVIDLT